MTETLPALFLERESDHYGTGYAVKVRHLHHDPYVDHAYPVNLTVGYVWHDDAVSYGAHGSFRGETFHSPFYTQPGWPVGPRVSERTRESAVKALCALRVKEITGMERFPDDIRVFLAEQT